MVYVAQALLNCKLIFNTTDKNIMVITQYNFKFAASKCSAFTKTFFNP